MKLLEKIVQYLQGLQGGTTTNRQMADAFVNELYVDEYRDKRGGVIQLSREINKFLGDMMSSGKYPQIQIIEGVKPKTYRWNATDTYRIDINGNFERMSKPVPIVNKQRKSKKKGKDEEGLYEPLIQYLRKELGIYAKRIDEKKNPNKGGKGRNKWRHPDIVGVKGLISDKKLHPTIAHIAKHTTDKAKLYAFEVKERVTGASLREQFHQTVSCTIWANFGYLCAEHFDKDTNTEKELKQLNNACGIGFIIINRRKPEKSEIYMKAKEKKEDLEICSTLMDNGDFSEFMNRALNVFENGKVIFY